jgi:hypothetical protein
LNLDLLLHLLDLLVKGQQYQLLLFHRLHLRHLLQHIKHLDFLLHQDFPVMDLMVVCFLFLLLYILVDLLNLLHLNLQMLLVMLDLYFFQLLHLMM